MINKLYEYGHGMLLERSSSSRAFSTQNSTETAAATSISFAPTWLRAWITKLAWPEPGFVMKNISVPHSSWPEIEGKPAKTQRSQLFLDPLELRNESSIPPSAARRLPVTYPIQSLGMSST